MNFYYLERNVDGTGKPGEVGALLVHAEHEEDARNIAVSNAGSEGGLAWALSEMASCIKLEDNEPAGAVLMWQRGEDFKPLSAAGAVDVTKPVRFRNRASGDNAPFCVRHSIMAGTLIVSDRSASVTWDGRGQAFFCGTRASQWDIENCEAPNPASWANARGWTDQSYLYKAAADAAQQSVERMNPGKPRDVNTHPALAAPYGVLPCPHSADATVCSCSLESRRLSYPDLYKGAAAVDCHVCGIGAVLDGCCNVCDAGCES